MVEDILGLSVTLLLTAVVVGLSLLWLWLHLTNHPRPATTRLPPGPGFALPVLGHLHLLGKDPRVKLHQWRERYGDVFSVLFGSRQVVILCGFPAIREAFVKQTKIDDVTSKFMNKIEALEERLIVVEKERDKLQREVEVVQKTNGDLFEMLNKQNKQTAALRKGNTDSEQYGRGWNLRVYNIPESKAGEPETTNACTQKLSDLFTSKLGVAVTEADIKAAHRTGSRTSQHTGPRPMIVRFLSRRKKDEVLANRRKLKGNPQNISIADDLTSLNFKLLKEAKEHSATLDAWSSRGKIFAKIKNGKTVRLEVDVDVDEILRRAM